MPIYEYQCKACGHQMDAIQKLSDPVLTDCPECGKPQLEKMISAPSFHLKGSGWYVTDFKDGGKSKDKPEEKSKDKPKDPPKKANKGKKDEKN